MAKRLEGKLTLVTGGSRGIGAAIAGAFAREGARVVIASRKQAGLDQVAAEINAKYKDSVIPRACHVGHADQVQGLFDFIDAELGALDVLVNNAGTNPYFGPMLGISEELFDKTFQVNLKGVFEPTRCAVAKWTGEEKQGAIVSIASIAGIQAAPLQGVYGMTKAAIISMTKTLAVELGTLGIRINAIAPGLIDTRLSAALTGSPEIVKIFTDHTALKRYGQAGEIAEMAVYLGSDESSFVTGQTFCVDGGYTIT
jgi:NAD(P)-dependent dehydrogenase (short-subunit alcohol dehydrogenase family)